MIHFFAAQAANPAPLLIFADGLEEHGDAAGAFALRGLAGAGIASLHVLALQGALGPLPFNPDLLRSAPTSGNGDGDGFTFGAGGESGYGYGDGCGHGEEYCSDGGVEGESD